jgi:hypothetical protein
LSDFFRRANPQGLRKATEIFACADDGALFSYPMDPSTGLVHCGIKPDVRRFLAEDEFVKNYIPDWSTMESTAVLQPFIDIFRVIFAGVESRMTADKFISLFDLLANPLEMV